MAIVMFTVKDVKNINIAVKIDNTRARAKLKFKIGIVANSVWDFSIHALHKIHLHPAKVILSDIAVTIVSCYCLRTANANYHC